MAILLFAFVYPPSLAQAKDSSLSNALHIQTTVVETNSVVSTGELLIAQRRPIRQRQIQRQIRRQQIRRQIRRQQIRRQIRREQIRRRY